MRELKKRLQALEARRRVPSDVEDLTDEDLAGLLPWKIRTLSPGGYPDP